MTVAITSKFSVSSSWLRRMASIGLFSVLGGLLASCGGGGVAAPDSVGGALAVLPATSDLYEGQPITFTISGGKKPYRVFSTNQTLAPLNATVDGNTFTVTAKSTAVDTDVTITVQDSTPTTVTVTGHVRAAVLNNSVTITPTASGQTCGSSICSGGDGVISTTIIANGAPQKNRNVRFDVYQGDYSFVTPGTNALVTTLTTNTDEQGVARVIIRAKNAAPSQTAIVQITDVVSAAFKRHTFTIAQQTSNTAITITPSTVTWVGAYTNACVTGGLSTHYIFGGTPPYTISSTDNVGLTFAPSTVNVEGGAVTVATTGLVCTIGSAGATLIVRDATGRNASFTIVNNTGSGTPPSPGAAVTLPAPTVANVALGGLDCGISASTFVSQTIPTGYTGTTPTLTAISAEPTRVGVVISGGVLTVTRVGTGPGGLGSVLVRVSNGTTATTDVTVSLNGSTPWACSVGTGSTNPVTTSVGTGVSVTSGTAPGDRAAVIISGGTPPYTVASSASTIADLSLNGTAFVTSLYVCAGSSADPTGAPVGTCSGITPPLSNRTFIIRGKIPGVTFATITDSTPAASGGPLTTVIIVTVN
jgi:hypothetical protein